MVRPNLTNSQHKNYSACGLRSNIYNAPAQPDIADRHHSTSQIDFLSFISQNTLRQHKHPDPCHHLICSTSPGSEARTCQLLIAAEEKTSNPTPKCSLSSCLSILNHYPLSFLFPLSPISKLASAPSYQLLLASPVSFFLLAFITHITSPHHSSMRRRISSSIRRHPSPIPCQNTNTQASHANKISPCTNGTEICRH